MAIGFLERVFIYIHGIKVWGFALLNLSHFHRILKNGDFFHYTLVSKDLIIHV